MIAPTNCAACAGRRKMVPGRVVPQPAAKPLRPDLGAGAVKGRGTDLGTGMDLGTVKGMGSDLGAEAVKAEAGDSNVPASEAMLKESSLLLLVDRLPPVSEAVLGC